jgi:uncharacterized protein (TIGR03067 family)
MKRCALLLVAVALLGAENKDDASKADLAKMQGTWQITTVEEDGKKVPAEKLAKAELIIKDDTYTLKVGDEPRAGTFTLDATKTPKAIDRTGKDGPNKDKTFPGIYEVDDNTLRVCFAQPGKDRPTKLTSEGGLQLMILKRK